MRHVIRPRAPSDTRSIPALIEFLHYAPAPSTASDSASRRGGDHGDSGRVAARGVSAADRHDFQPLGVVDTRLCGRSGGERRTGGSRGLRHGGSRARRPDHAGHDLRGGLGVEAVHRGRGAPARARRQVVAGRSGSQVPSRAPRFRRAACTIRHMLHHTSGLRDWGNLRRPLPAGRVARVCTVTRTCSTSSAVSTRSTFRRARTGRTAIPAYNLAAIMVSRVSGMSFADFTQSTHLRAARHDAIPRGATTTRASSSVAPSPTVNGKARSPPTCRSRTSTEMADC